MADAATRRPELRVPIKRDGTDLIAPALDIEPDAETGREVAR